MVNDSNAEGPIERMVHLARGGIELGDVASLTTQDKVRILQFGMAQMQVGHNERAARVLEGLVALDGRNPLYRQYFGLALERMGEHNAALLQYTANVEGLKTLDDPARLTTGLLLRARLNAQRGAMKAAAEDLSSIKAQGLALDAKLSQEMEMLERAVSQEAS